jgi:hypothetical protein
MCLERLLRNTHFGEDFLTASLSAQGKSCLPFENASSKVARLHSTEELAGLETLPTYSLAFDQALFCTAALFVFPAAAARAKIVAAGLFRFRSEWGYGFLFPGP